MNLEQWALPQISNLLDQLCKASPLQWRNKCKQILMILHMNNTQWYGRAPECVHFGHTCDQISVKCDSTFPLVAPVWYTQAPGWPHPHWLTHWHTWSRDETEEELSEEMYVEQTKQTLQNCYHCCFRVRAEAAVIRVRVSCLNVLPPHSCWPALTLHFN